MRAVIVLIVPLLVLQTGLGQLLSSPQGVSNNLLANVLGSMQSSLPASQNSLQPPSSPTASGALQSLSVGSSGGLGTSTSDSGLPVNSIAGTSGLSPGSLLQNSMGGSLGSMGVQSGGLGGAIGYNTNRQTCTSQERQQLFNSCLIDFGWQHMRYFGYLRSSRTCRAEVFDCRSVDRMVRCINSQPVNVVSNQCWSGIKETLTQILNNYGIPCSHDDLYRACAHASQEILPLHMRPQRTGRGQNHNPFIPMFLMLHLQGNLGHALGL